ncbi:uncharacterized protein LOC132952688 isoform X1 [Metopolophium dirhodum]|uniref:uncharacterized protein LOC132952688 isoform X1 n=1 Tax=Metopolophium dirhodum TaxID=44670 RepID=UPI00299010BE|nr:uncharacterized protein LOC132952688 isoform X1 [Metopolophium dirhodum]XP_060881049.1 uncharacterized protein LOC132952688 isoform X1 [Metopolophium dirhodum]XP_060881050.1 uncharacterized protein LOC132952688 isoform X1 [Metopolophium dirhodum]XP_060881051.1 uncharacterized protein LOC132952688 isoform X1 [Metopolophium dirhodum]XP_060881052.1 uncharacterized protein LOC132952688 isoform X1 [Metopolophium dirhodum]XP_060881053.1 uncharacterized protein LOC132952688 isoform X1 [Metopolophi
MLLKIPFTSGTFRYNDEQLTRHSGLYYENRGPLKLITSQWDLTAYINLAKYKERFVYIDDIMNQTETLCITIAHNVDNNCKNLVYTANTIVRELRKRRELVIKSIEHKLSKRSTTLGTIAKAARLIYGICNLECIKRFTFNIGQTHDATQTKFVKEQIKIVKLQTKFDEYENYNTTFVYNESINISREQQTKNYLLKHFVIVNLLITKHMLETNTLLEIIQQAKIGIIHTSLISPRELLENIKDIKVSLPGGTDLPTDLDIQNIYELVKLSDITIYYANDNLVFILTLPLIYQNDFILYNLIPMPVCTENDCYYIKPSNKYLAISKTKEHYALYDEFYYTHCKHARDFLLCPEGNPLHPRTSRPACEVQLLQDPIKVPTSCEIMHVQMSTSIFHKKRFKNEWIYVTNYDIVFITCDEDKESTSHTLRGVGILSLNETCKAYAARDVLIPGKVDYKSEYMDFNPKSVLEHIKDMPFTDNNNLMEDYHVKTNNMEDLHKVSGSNKQLEKQRKVDNKIDELKDTQERNDYILYVITSSIFMTVIILIINMVKEKTVTNHTEVAQSQEETEELDANPMMSSRGIDMVEFPLAPRNSPTGYPTLRTFLN